MTRKRDEAMNLNKQKERTETYFDIRSLEYIRKDVSFSIKLSERQAGKHYFEEKHQGDMKGVTEHE